MHRKPQATKEVVLNWDRGAQICFPGDPNINQEGYVQLYWQVGAICILDIRNSSSRETCRHQTVWYIKGPKSSWILLQYTRKGRRVGLEYPHKPLLNLNHYLPSVKH